eukprot:2760931-Lingulodinium_polyedra.AAC.1
MRRALLMLQSWLRRSTTPHGAPVLTDDQLVPHPAKWGRGGARGLPDASAPAAMVLASGGGGRSTNSSS